MFIEFMELVELVEIVEDGWIDKVDDDGWTDDVFNTLRFGLFNRCKPSLFGLIASRIGDKFDILLLIIFSLFWLAFIILFELVRVFVLFNSDVIVLFKSPDFCDTELLYILFLLLLNAFVLAFGSFVIFIGTNSYKK